ncbi:MAG: hypothetical protein AB7T49_06600 [Oligoflexales bacterium]
MVRNNRWLGTLLLTLSLGQGCGKDSGKSTIVSLSPTEKLFQTAARKYDIPYRMLLAVAFKESGLSTVKETAIYQTRDNQIGTSLTETAFGLSRRKLGLEDAENPESLAVQIDAYARWLRENLDASRLSLSSNPGDAVEKYYWIWNISMLHRAGVTGKRNTQIVFAKELLNKLNEGDFWQDTETGDVVRLEKEPKPIVIENLPIEVQDNLDLQTEPTEIPLVEYFELTFAPVGNDNKPNHIKVIHCPLTLSACLELQNPSETEDQARMSAHYIIPPDLSVVKGALQVASTVNPVIITNQEGKPEEVKDAIVVMLVGDSGHYVEGRRTVANPKWMDESQLARMGNLINKICNLLHSYDKAVNVDECLKPGGPHGIEFVHQGSSETFQWGDIPDYDEDIFWAHIKSGSMLSGEVGFHFKRKDKIYSATNPVNFNVNYFKGTAMVVLELLSRCPDGKVVWYPLTTKFIRNEERSTFDMPLYYQGPNANGQHFFRALVYDQFSQLIGWAVDDIFLTGYETELSAPHNDKICTRIGS